VLTFIRFYHVNAGNTYDGYASYLDARVCTEDKSATLVFFPPGQVLLHIALKMPRAFW